MVVMSNIHHVHTQTLLSLPEPENKTDKSDFTKFGMKNWPYTRSTRIPPVLIGFISATVQLPLQVSWENKKKISLM